MIHCVDLICDFYVICRGKLFYGLNACACVLNGPVRALAEPERGASKIIIILLVIARTRKVSLCFLGPRALHHSQLSKGGWQLSRKRKEQGLELDFDFNVKLI